MRFIPTSFTRAIGTQTLLAQKNAPHILFGVGVVGMIGSTVLACRATLKLNELTHEAQVELDRVKDADDPRYSEEDRKKDTTTVYFQNAVKFAKLYGPAVVLGAASVVCLAKSHTILVRRNAAITAAYVAVDEAFKQYRKRVVEKYGDQEDRLLRYGGEEVEMINEDSGKIETVVRVGPNGESQYARFFDPTSPEWSDDPSLNFVFLQAVQNWHNNILLARGYVFLNEVYQALGLEATTAGQVVGWVISRDGDTDNYIDFGIMDGSTQAKRDFVNGREGSILLDFNVDGVIYDRLADRGGKKLRWQS
jgi:Family of unknown function (DUF6353)